MILSHRHRFIFVKTRKTAGTSIEVFLAQICGMEDVVTPISPPVESHRPRNYRGLWNPLKDRSGAPGYSVRSTVSDLIHLRKFFNHMSGSLLRSRIGPQLWDSYFTFCVERNPWDRAISHYESRRSRGRYAGTFDEYLHSPDLCLNLPLYTAKDGSVIVDRIFRYEQLDAEIESLCARLKIPWPGHLSVRAKGSYRRDRRPYQERYTPEQRLLVQEACAAEIALHGYEF